MSIVLVLPKSSTIHSLGGSVEACGMNTGGCHLTTLMVRNLTRFPVPFQKVSNRALGNRLSAYTIPKFHFVVKNKG